MKLGIVGSRRRASLHDKKLVKEIIKELQPDVIVSGGCARGADNFAEYYAEKYNIPITIHRPFIKGDMTYADRIRQYYWRNGLVAKDSDVLFALVAADRHGGTENTIKQFMINKNNWKDKLILK